MLKQYLKPQLEIARAKMNQSKFDGSQALLGNQGELFLSQSEQAQRQLSKQLKAINMFEETQSAVQLELNINKLNVSRRLKDLNQQVKQLESKVKTDDKIIKAAEFDPIK